MDSTPPPSATLPAPPPAPEDGIPRIGETVAGKYVLERILGSGGMGVVAEARHVTLGELVAIKFLRASAKQDKEIAERFVREAKTALRIKSEHVVRVHDIGTTERGVSYLVMEHLVGTDLSSLVGRDGPLPIPVAIDYLLQACEGLAEAHALGIVHRDLKPSNLFLTMRSDQTPLVKVLDFGIAKAQGPDNATLTETHAVFGSPAYMSPEQIRSAKNVDGRSDIWSLGVVLYELLAGCIPFAGESSAAVLAAVSADAPRSLRSLRPEVPAPLADAIDSCLQKDPQKRMPSILAFAQAIAPFAGGQSSISVDRIRRLSNPPSGSVAAAAMRPPSNSIPISGSHGTARGWATTAHASPPEHKRARVLALVGVTVLSIGAGFAFMKTRSPAAPNATATAPPSAPAATTNATTAATAPTPPAPPLVSAAPTPQGSAAIVADTVAVPGPKQTRQPRPATRRDKRAPDIATPAPPTPAVAPPAAPSPPPTPAPARPVDVVNTPAAQDRN